MPTYTIRTANHGDRQVVADDPGLAVLQVCRTTGERTWNCAILARVGEPVPADRLDECSTDSFGAELRAAGAR